MLRQVLVLEDTHPDSIAVLTVDKEFMNQLTFDHKAQLTVDMDRLFVLFINDEVQLIEVKYGKSVVHRQSGSTGGKTFSLILRGNNDLKFGPTMDMVDFNQFDQTCLFSIAFDDKTTFALIVNVLVVKIRQLDKRFVRLFNQ